MNPEITLHELQQDRPNSHMLKVWSLSLLVSESLKHFLKSGSWEADVHLQGKLSQYVSKFPVGMERKWSTTHSPWELKRHPTALMYDAAPRHVPAETYQPS